MKKGKIICTLMIMAMCSCANTNSTVKEEQGAESPTVETPAVQAEYVKALTQEPGTVFYDLTLEKALEKAKNDGKYVLVDCHTKTCGPCRKMERETFPQEKLGKFINERFVPIMVDMDEGEGPAIAEKYNVQIFPTYLILLPNGAKEGEIIGTEFNIDDLIGMLKKIIHEKD